MISVRKKNTSFAEQRIKMETLLLAFFYCDRYKSDQLTKRGGVIHKFGEFGLRLAYPFFFLI